jgi:hypothetical protein
LRFPDESLNDFALLSDNLIEGCSMKILSLLGLIFSVFVALPTLAQYMDCSKIEDSLNKEKCEKLQGQQFDKALNPDEPSAEETLGLDELNFGYVRGEDLADDELKDKVVTVFTKRGPEVPADFSGFGSRKMRDCGEHLKDAGTMCDPKQNQQVMGVVTMANGAMSAFSAMSAQGACGSLGKLANNANMATAAFSGYCSKSYFSCTAQCSQDMEDIKSDLEELRNEGAKAKKDALAEASRGRKLAADLLSAKAKKIYEYYTQTQDAYNVIKQQNAKCESFSKNVMDAGQSIVGLMGVSMQMSQCQKLTGLDCTKSPNDPICVMLNGGGSVVDCSTTAGQSNPVCICQINPSAPQCASDTSGFNAGIGSGSGGADAGNLDLSKFGGPGGFGDGGTGIFPAGAGPGEGGLGGSLQKGGSGRGNAQESGGGSNGRGGAAAGGPGGSGINTKIIGGYGVGGSGGGGSGGGSGYSRGNTGGYGAGAGNPNLKQYLPGGKMDPSRSIAGETGPDGITGPNTDIWKKVKTRYFAKKPSLLP